MPQTSFVFLFTSSSHTQSLRGGHAKLPSNSSMMPPSLRSKRSMPTSSQALSYPLGTNIRPLLGPTEAHPGGLSGTEKASKLCGVSSVDIGEAGEFLALVQGENFSARLHYCCPNAFLDRYWGDCGAEWD